MPSLGHVATTLSHPLSTSHRGLDEAALSRAEISPGLLRCSAGLESIDDLVEDFDQALRA
jgi:cystathionine beta-lyase/cystathionine gamma-synthase